MAANFGTDGGKQPISLMGLPKELRSYIFNYAYQRSESTKLVCGGKPWLNKELKQKRLAIESGSTYTAREFTPKVAEMLVSKLYFVEAAETYVGGSPVCWHLEFPSPALCHGNSILHAFSKELTLPFAFVHYCANMPNLKTLALDISTYRFLGEEEIVPVQHEILSEADFERCTLFLDFTRTSVSKGSTSDSFRANCMAWASGKRKSGLPTLSCWNQ